MGCQHPLGGGQGPAEEARPVNPNFTIQCDSLGLFYVLDFQPKLLLSIWAYLNHFQLLLFFPQYRKDNFLLEKLCLAGKLFVTSSNEWRDFLMQNMLSPDIE